MLRYWWKEMIIFMWRKCQVIHWRKKSKSSVELGNYRKSLLQINSM